MKEYKFNISITEKCNLRCPHCYTRNKQGSLTREEVDIIIGNLEDGLTRVKIEGENLILKENFLLHYPTI